MKFLAVFLVFIVSLQTFGGSSPSAVRKPGRDYKEYIIKNKLPLPLRNLPRSYLRAAQEPGSTARPTSVSISGEQVTPDQVTQIYTREQLNEAFAYVRDLRFLEKDNRPEFPRRLSWMYPDDGCWLRADLMGKLLEARKQPMPNKVFIFGNLNVKTANSPYGSVSWWYHVAPAVRVDGEVYILDPALEPKHPMLLRDWVLAQVPTLPDAKLSVCSPFSFNPSSLCNQQSPEDETAVKSNITYYLGSERSRLQELNRNAERELGEFPPWIEVAPVTTPTPAPIP